MQGFSCVRPDPEESRVFINKLLRFKLQVCGCTYSQMKLKEFSYFITRHFYSEKRAFTYENNQEYLNPQ